MAGQPETLPDFMAEIVRAHPAARAWRERVGGTWRSQTWGEISSEISRVTTALGHLERGRRIAWSAPFEGRHWVVDLAMIHLGVPGEMGGNQLIWTGDSYARLIATREEPGRLLRLRKEIRPRDPAAVVDGTVLDHAAVAGMAGEAVAKLAAGPREEILVSIGASVERRIVWAAARTGFGIAVGDASALPEVAPVVWVCTPAQLASVAPPPSRAGRLGGWVRALGRTDGALGRNLRRVVVDGTPPREAGSLIARGITVESWDALRMAPAAWKHTP